MPSRSHEEYNRSRGATTASRALGEGKVSEQPLLSTSSREFGVWLPVVFFLSGFAALLYQVVWQRVLYTIVGINVESVTVVVTAFLLGLGLGSLAGGVVSRRPERPLLLIFVLIELGIGTFGVVSLPLFHRASFLTLGLSAAQTAIVTFLLVLVPTLLMGSTLPLLVSYTVRASGNVGRSVGLLYFVNTAGSALAAMAAVLGLLRNLGEQGTVLVAVALNVTVSVSVLYQYFRTGGGR